MGGQLWKIKSELAELYLNMEKMIMDYGKDLI